MQDLVPITPDEVLTLGLFELGNETIAIDVRFLAEVAHIDVLQHRITGDDNALGLISIRGVLVPVIDPLGIYRSAKSKPSTAAVLTDSERVSGLAVNRVMGLRRFEARSLQRLTGDGGENLTAGTIYENGALIHVLNAEAILRRADIPKAFIDPRKTQKSERSLATPLLTFEAGGVSFAMKADKIVGTVPQQGIEDTTMASDRFLGSITYYDRRVPIMSTNRVFGLGDPGCPTRFETVVLRFPDDRLLGLTADRIVHVANSKEGEERPWPAMWEVRSISFGRRSI
jgi:purine-binding chemotaxis protein CheW